MPVTPVTDWGQALLTSAAAALALFLSAIPKVIGFVVILAIGWFIASAIATVVATLLRSVRFNELAHRAGLSEFVDRMGLHMDPASLMANIAKWFVRLVALVVAFDALGLPAVSQVLQSFLLWIPNLVVALVVLVIGGLAAKALSRLVRGATAEGGLGNPDLLATIAQFAVWAFAIVIAINQIGVATTLVNTLFMGTVGALALALGLAFGLGGRETAARIVNGWYEQGRTVAPRAREIVTPASERAEERMGNAGNGRGIAR
jgi:small-conductance mechanosensitive channel